MVLWLKLNNFHQVIFSRLLPRTGGFQGHWSYMLSNCPPESLCNLYFFQLGGVCWFPHDFDNAGHYNNNKKKTPKNKFQLHKGKIVFSCSWNCFSFNMAEFKYYIRLWDSLNSFVNCLFVSSAHFSTGQLALFPDLYISVVITLPFAMFYQFLILLILILSIILKLVFKCIPFSWGVPIKGVFYSSLILGFSVVNMALEYMAVGMLNSCIPTWLRM